jgi:YVTN family beta-propeller protein
MFSSGNYDLHLLTYGNLLEVSDDGRRLFAASTRSNSLAVVDAATFKVLARLPGGAGVYGVALSPDGRYAYLLSTDQVTVVDTARLAVAYRLALEDSLRRGFFFARWGTRNVAFTPARRRAYFADAAGLHVLSLSSGAETKRLEGVRGGRTVLAPRAADVTGEAGKVLVSHLEKAARLEAEGKLDVAAEEYRQARVLSPNDDSLVEDIARKYIQAGQLEAAAREMQRWVAEAPGDPRRCWKLAALYLDRQRPKEAIAHIHCALAGGEAAGVPVAFMHVEMAKALMDTGDSTGAREHAMQAKALGDLRADRVLKQLEKER